MAKYRQRRQDRYNSLRENHFTPFEAREFSVLPKKTPALVAMIDDRNARWDRFMKMAQHRVERGSWRIGQIQGKWRLNLKRLYYKKKWRVQDGPKGKQKGPSKGSPSPWAMYREYEQQAPDKGYVSPWELKQVMGATPLDRGQIFIQKSDNPAITPAQVKQWIADLNANIRSSTDERKERLITQRDRLNKLL